MAITTLVLGNSGTGKSTSMRNLDPAKVLLIQAIGKPLPFKAGKWKPLSKDSPDGSILVSDNADSIKTFMTKTKKKIIILDDSNYIMANSFMRRALETGYQKFTEMAQQTFSIFETANSLPEDVRVYLFSHTQVGEDGVARYRTVGRMLDERLSLEGMVTICLKSIVTDGAYYFATKNAGNDTVKTPMGMFDKDFIDNDLAAVDAAICNYYDLIPKE